MKVFLYELRKIFGSRKIVALLIAAAAINIGFLLYTEYSMDYTPSAYNALWDELDSMPQERQVTFLEEKYSALENFMFSSDISQISPEYTGNMYSEIQLTDHVRTEVESCSSYGEYLESVNESAETLLAIPFFADENSFDYKNIIKTREDFEALSGQQPLAQRSEGVLAATRFGIADVLLLMLIVLFNVLLISREKELDQLSLFHPTAKGGASLAVSKLCAVFTADIAAVLLICGGSYAVSCITYGFGSLNRDIQSVSGFFASGLDITVGEYLLYFLLLKILICFAFSALCFLFSGISGGSILNIIITASFTAAEAAFYFIIEPSSYLAPLRQINLVAAADGSGLLGRYLNINFFGTPVNALPVSVTVAVVFTLAFSAAGVWVFCKNKTYAARNTGLILPFGKHTSLLSHELHKTFISGKALLLLIISALFIIFTYSPVKVTYSSVPDFIYVRYVNQLQGDVTEEKIAFVESETEAALNSASEISEDTLEALGRLRIHMEYLQTVNGKLFNDKGYQMLTGCGDSKQTDRFTACALSLLMAIIAAYIYCEEYRTGAIQLLRSSPGGKASTFLRKLITAAAAAFALLIIFDGSRFVSVLSTYTTEYITAPAASMEHLESMGGMPMILYFTLLIVGRFVALVLQSAAVFFLSSKIKSRSLTIIAGTVVFAVPPIVSAVGFDFMDYFLTMPLLIGNMIGL